MTRGALAAAGFTRHENDGTVFFSAGEGETLVLVHGVNDHAGSWFLVAPTLAQNYRVIIPDLPGHGESEPKEGQLPISLMAAKLAAVIGNERVTLVGNSMGGWLSMLCTLARPQNVSRLILESPGGLARPLASPVAAHDRDEALIILRNVHGPRFQPEEWVIDALLQRAISSPMLRVTEIAEHFVDARLGEIGVPTAIVWGAEDGVVPRAYAEAVQQGIPNATLHVIDGAAHIPHLQQPERFVQCLSSIS
jgi:pimeloyl-ACP methyl ester carboxylesterase